MIKSETDHKRVGFAFAHQRLHPLDTVDFATRFRLRVYASQNNIIDLSGQLRWIK